MKSIGFAILAASTFAISVPIASASTVNLDAQLYAASESEGAAAIAASDLLDILLTAGSYRIDVVSGVFNAFLFTDPSPTGCNSAGEDCVDGWTVSYNVFDALGANILHFGIGDSTYATADLALQKAQDEGPRMLEILTSGTYYFGVSDGMAFRFDNTGGVSLNVTAVPLPAALPLLASTLAALGFVARRRKQKAVAAT